jgi:hypothetical protein
VGVAGLGIPAFAELKNRLVGEVEVEVENEKRAEQRKMFL